MEVIEELQGPVIIITPPQEHFRRPHNTDNSVYLHLALWGNGELYKSMQKRVLNIFICSLCTLIFLNTVFYPTLNFVYWLMSRWGLSNLNNCLELIFGLLCPETSNVIVWKINFRTLSNAIADEGSFGDWSLVLENLPYLFSVFLLGRLGECVTCFESPGDGPLVAGAGVSAWLWPPGRDGVTPRSPAVTAPLPPPLATALHMPTLWHSANTKSAGDKSGPRRVNTELTRRLTRYPFKTARWPLHCIALPSPGLKFRYKIYLLISSQFHLLMFYFKECFCLVLVADLKS